ncbi:hypothetical protein KUCAC02_028994 [Chaenocephalus aceratus]|uniref:Uncharacterized protein n=1 Tax=Chaenocephalus aceratus TaxID=36190 RepID=A0ACB9X526_CHAAC|nr:hypothetical protein KUCAC02_028994 [Chaenocephalus aceratus]
MIASTHSVASSFLPASARVNPASQSQANQGSETIRQQCQGKMPVPVINRIANAEAMVLGTLAEHSIPFSKAPVIVELAQTLSLDKPALQGMKLSRTAASYKMIHGLDKSTSNNNKKILSMLVCYYHADLRKVIVEHLGSLEIVKVNAASLEKVLCEFFEKNNIPWNNLVSMLMDLCAVMRGSPLTDLEKLFSDLQVDHKWSPDQVMYLKEIAMILNISASSPQRGFVPHRWLSAYDASMATHAMMPAYKVLYYGFLSTADKELYREPLELMYTKYHVNQAGRARIKVVQEELNRKGMTPQGRERKKRVCKKLWHEETTTVLRLSIYMGLLTILKEYVMVFQGSQTLVHKLHDRQLELFLAFMACFVKAEHITQLSPRPLREMVLEDHMLLPSKEVYVGQEADTFRSQNPNHALLVPFLADVRKA